MVTLAVSVTGQQMQPKYDISDDKHTLTQRYQKTAEHFKPILNYM